MLDDYTSSLFEETSPYRRRPRRPAASAFRHTRRFRFAAPARRRNSLASVGDDDLVIEVGLELDLDVELDREVELVHRSELARLLREAARLRPLGRRHTMLFTWKGRVTSLGGWRRRVRRALALCERDRFRPHAASLLSGLCDSRIATWPGVVELALAAVETRDSEAARLTLGQALLDQGEAARAALVFRDLLRRGDALEERWRALEGLASSHEELGRPRLALGAMEAAAEEPGCGVEPLVRGLVLALVVGDGRRARRAAARLDLLVDPECAAFRRVVAGLRPRLDRMRVRRKQRLPDTAVLLADRSLGGRSPAQIVCRLLG